MSVEIFPVVHIQNSAQAVEQAGIALEAGANGVFLIDHKSANASALLAAYQSVYEAYPENFIGLNFLHFQHSLDTFKYLNTAFRKEYIGRLPNAVWADDVHRCREELYQLRERNDELKNIKYLGGIAFKYSRTYTDKPVSAALETSILAAYVDVVTTSGPGTGMPPSLDKIKSMKRAAGDKPLAVASGVSSENIEKFKPYIDQLLVASSIETRPLSGEFDKEKIKTLVELAHK